MDFDFIRSATSKELEQFKSVCNRLLSRTYIVRTLFRPGKGRVNNPDYTFLSLHYEAVQEYLSLLDWDLRKDDLNGYFYVINTDEANRCNLNKKETAILLALRMIYEENQEQLGLEQDAVCAVRDVLEKVVTDYAILPAKPNMDEVKRALKAGRIARLGDLGSLQIGLNSEGAVSVKEFSSSLITAAHIIFRPGKTLADITKILSYQQVTTRAVAQTGGSGNEGEDDDKGSGGGSDGGGSGEAPDPAA